MSLWQSTRKPNAKKYGSRKNVNSVTLMTLNSDSLAENDTNSHNKTLLDVCSSNSSSFVTVLGDKKINSDSRENLPIPATSDFIHPIISPIMSESNGWKQFVIPDILKTAEKRPEVEQMSIMTSRDKKERTEPSTDAKMMSVDRHLNLLALSSDGISRKRADENIDCTRRNRPRKNGDVDDSHVTTLISSYEEDGIAEDSDDYFSVRQAGSTSSSSSSSSSYPHPLRLSSSPCTPHKFRDADDNDDDDELLPVTDISSRPLRYDAAATCPVIASYQTPVGIKMACPDWGVSHAANPLSIIRLRTALSQVSPPPSVVDIDREVTSSRTKRQSFGLKKRLSIGSSSSDQVIDMCYDDYTHLFVDRYPMGNLIGQGSYKQVFSLNAHLALAVTRSDDEFLNIIAKNDLSWSQKASRLAQQDHVPNYVTIHECYNCPVLPPFAPLKSSYQHKRRNLVTREEFDDDDVDKQYQYVMMDLCNGRDLETYFRNYYDNDTDIDFQFLTSIVFQIIYSVYCLRSELSLVHRDLKLLNHLIHFSQQTYKYYIGNAVYHVSGDEHCGIVKLIDFGCSCCCRSALSIGLDDFSTLENTPIEYLAYGSACACDYSGDSWRIGLSLIQVCIGIPYEEHLASVTCPRSLLRKLKDIWEVCDDDDVYALVRDVIQSEETDKSENRILYDTFYRYLVIFGLDSMLHQDGLVWDAVRDDLFCSNRSRGSKSQYESDVAQYSLKTGTSKEMQRFRSVAKCMCGMEALVRSLTDFEASRRPTLKNVLQSAVFSVLKVDLGKTETSVELLRKSDHLLPDL